MNIDARITLLRTKMKEIGLDAYIVPSSDPHQSEYVAKRWMSREWISGFTGSAGTAVITHDKAGVWTDSRYFIQAEQELADSEFVLFKMADQFAPSFAQWLCEELEPNATVGLDGWCSSQNQKLGYESHFAKKGINLDTKYDIFDSIWAEREGIPDNPVFVHDIKYCGKSRSEKINDIRMEMNKQGATHHLVTTLDDIAWILNLRGYDVEFNPVFIAYAVIGMDKTILFINDHKVPEAIKTELTEEGVELKSYDTILPYLNGLDASNSILIDPSSCSVTLYKATNCNIIKGTIPSRLMKAIKNETEISHLKNVMVKDGVALANTFYWLENTLKEKTVSEFELSEKLAHFRSQQADYYGESFAAIIGYNGNGAIVHYRPMPDTSAQIKAQGVLLADSGGQYFDGTTDITRTFALSEPNDKLKNAYTRVLKGHIMLATAQFPKGTLGVQLDILARHALWQNGLNYLHGTGHGVGFFMNVHEAPQGFSAGLSGRSRTELVPGMYSSNEPGYYEENEFGIRIENLFITTEAKDEGFLNHETITMYPIDTKMIDVSLLDNAEIEWLNSYHETVFERLAPHLSEEMKPWLKNQCTPLKK